MLIELFKKYQQLIYQFSRFLGIGFLNTGVDYSIINILIAVTTIASGPKFAVLKVISFSVAVIHSYYWNKYWAFMKVQENFFNFLVKVAIAGITGVAIVAAAIYGSGRQFSSLYFVMLLLALFVAEAVLWRAFKLNLVVVEKQKNGEQFTLFIMVSIIGALFAAGIVWIMTSAVQPMFGANPRLWANIANAVSVVFVLFWNFFGYKLLVFKK